MSIDENDVCICDYCGEDFGEFDQETGNHPRCEELAALRAERDEYLKFIKYLRYLEEAEDANAIMWHIRKYEVKP